MGMALLGPKLRLLVDVPPLQKCAFWTFFKHQPKMVSQSAWFQSWPLLVPPKKGPKDVLKGSFWDPQMVKTQHVDSLHRNVLYNRIPLVFCYI